MPVQQQSKPAQTARPSMNSSAARQPPTKKKEQSQQQQAQRPANPKRDSMNSSTARQPPTKPKEPSQNQKQPQAIPERDIRQNAGVSAGMSLQAAKKAWEFRQAMHGAADAQAREKLLAKAINKEVEAESFGKAAKYTQSGAFQGLAAGAGLGVKPGVTLGKVTGALVGGVVATVTGLLGGGIGSVYGAMNGPMWDLGEIASHGVHGMAKDVLGDWMPDFAATSSQKKALEKMVLQTKDTPTPSKDELEQIRAAAPDDMPQSWSQSAQQMTSYIPSMPRMPSMPSKASLPSISGMGGMTSAFGFGNGRRNTPKTEPAQAAASELPSNPQSEIVNDTRTTTKDASGSAKPAASSDTASTTRKNQDRTKSAANASVSVANDNPARRSAASAKTNAPTHDSVSTRAKTSKPDQTTSNKPSQVSRDSEQNKSKVGRSTIEQSDQAPRRKPRKLARGEDKSAVSSKKTPRKLQVRQASNS